MSSCGPKMSIYTLNDIQMKTGYFAFQSNSSLPTNVCEALTEALITPMKISSHCSKSGAGNFPCKPERKFARSGATFLSINWSASLQIGLKFGDNVPWMCVLQSAVLVTVRVLKWCALWCWVSRFALLKTSQGHYGNTCILASWHSRISAKWKWEACVDLICFRKAVFVAITDRFPPGCWGQLLKGHFKCLNWYLWYSW